jgi:hypothetical protein
MGFWVGFMLDGLEGLCFRTWSVADGCVEWRANNGNVVVLIRLD